MKSINEGKITASEVYLKHLFGEKYIFEIPNFQRPFAWTRENFEQLFDDIKDALYANLDVYGDKVKDWEPYFLGSVILWVKNLEGDGSGEYAIIDGQQRLVSLTILFAVIRDLAENLKVRNKMQKKIYQEADLLEGTPESIRIKMRSKEEEFFRQYILSEGGTNEIVKVDRNTLSEPKLHILEAVETFRKGFMNETGKVDQNFLQRFAMYLLQKVVLVVIRAADLSSAFRLFNVINARGLPLTNADLLKSENLSAIPKEEEEKYTAIWESLEEDLGSEKLEMLISFIRNIKLKEKARKSIYEEFENKIFKKEPDFKGKKFVEYLRDVAGIYYEKIDEASLNSEDEEKNVYYYNLMCLMRDFLPFNDWISAVIKFREKYTDNNALFDFLTKLEKKLVVDWLSGLTATERLVQIFKIIKLIEESQSAEEVLKNPLFYEEVKSKIESFKNALDNVNFYKKGNIRLPRYILLRIDMERSYNRNTKKCYAGRITVEHILPVTPNNQYWLDRFSEEDRLMWTNKLGNLVLLNGRKNTQAGNKPFPEKLADYFEKKSDFDITNELKKYNDWNIHTLQQRHNALIEEAVNIWIPQ